MADQYEGWVRGPVLINGNAVAGWVHAATGTGAVFLRDVDHPPEFMDYQPSGWVQVQDGRVVSPFFPKLHQRSADPDDPPLWAMV